MSIVAWANPNRLLEKAMFCWPALLGRVGLSMAAAAEPRGLCTAYRPSDIERARANIARHQWARDVRDSILSTCKQYHDLPPERLAALVPEKTPLVSGHCPKCGAHFASAEVIEHGDVLRHAMDYSTEAFRGQGLLSCGAVQDMGHSW